MFRLDGRVAVITGAASGIGAATARLYAEAGALVVLGWYPGDPHDVGPVVESVIATGGKALAVEVDVSDASSVERLVQTAVAELGGLDIVVANAGIARRVPSAVLSDDAFHQLLDVDLVGVFRCFRAAVPTMQAQGWGRLIATSSIAGAQYGWPDHVHYTAAKAGIVGLVRTFALDVARDGITVNAVAPGVVVSPQSSDPVNSLGPAGLEAFADTVPVGRNGRPEDIAATFLYLASDEASFLTGQTLTVDGGISLQLV